MIPFDFRSFGQRLRSQCPVVQQSFTLTQSQYFTHDHYVKILNVNDSNGTLLMVSW